MGIPATMSVSLAHSYAPYRFGAYPPACAPQVHHHYAYEMARQAQAIRDAANWWAMPRVMQPPASFPMMSHTVFGAPAYAFPPVQMPYQQYSVQPLGAIHNTRCATSKYKELPNDIFPSHKFPSQCCHHPPHLTWMLHRNHHLILSSCTSSATLHYSHRSRFHTIRQGSYNLIFPTMTRIYHTRLTSPGRTNGNVLRKTTTTPTRTAQRSLQQ